MTDHVLKLPGADLEFIEQIEKDSGQDLSSCYQCGNCSAGCPNAFVFDTQVSGMMRLLQLGQKEKALKSKAIWLCASCSTCTTRCPNNIDVAQIMDCLRHMARREGYRAAEYGVKSFWDSFNYTVKLFGRAYELGTVLGYVTRTGRMWADIDLAPAMLSRQKLPFKPHKIIAHKEVEEIFRRFQAGEHK